MAGETTITVVGNLTADPELRYTQNGLAVANFTIASTPRNFDRASNEWKDGEALFLRASVWRDVAEHVAGSLSKGSRVIVSGRLKQRSYETREGEKRTSMELEVDEIGPSLRYATAQVTRSSGGGGGGQQYAGSGGGRGQASSAGGGSGSGGSAGGDPWAAPGTSSGGSGSGSSSSGADGWSTPGAYDDDTPF
ncbi:single-stranded DNA-binding protein [uncultured Amnibacterium sp.]|uniref:single-stranded DNA-binding protein n=1 Tax=uncultured Amnibacterium sp. TaxID=1631851 RepID=UPI0035CA57E2